MIKLKLCPFCGEKATWVETYEHYFDGSKRCISEKIMCNMCGCIMPSIHGLEYGTNKWNKRTKKEG